MPFIAHDTARWRGASVGNGHCVAYVREACSAPHTSLWRAGEAVRGSGCARGTAIACFDPDGRYGNHVDGRSHAAVFVEETPFGLLVTDQWVGHRVAERVISFRAGKGKAVNDGSRYSIVEAVAPGH